MAPSPAARAEAPKHFVDVIERVILRRLREGKIEGYTLPMAQEIAADALDVQARLIEAAYRLGVREGLKHGPIAERFCCTPKRAQDALDAFLTTLPAKKT